MTSFLISAPLVPSKMRFSVTFYFLINQAQIWHKNWMLILIFGQKVVWETISDNMKQELLFYVSFLARRLLDITLPWQHLRSQVIKNYLKGCDILKLKVTRFQLPTPNGFWAVLKKNSGGGGEFASLPVQIRVKMDWNKSNLQEREKNLPFRYWSLIHEFYTWI